MSRRGPVHLLDVNLLVALAWPNHLHHRVAHRWFARRPRWSTCPLSESGFVRVSSNPRIGPDAVAPAAAARLLAEMIAVDGHEFWSDDVSLASDDRIDWRRVVGHRQVSDLHLLLLALRRGGRVATFDRGMAQLVPGGVDPAEAVTRLGGRARVP